MNYVVSWNTNDKKYIPKIHVAGCREIRKQGKNTISNTQKYSDTEFPELNLSSCTDIESFKNENKKYLENLACCSTCKPDCCGNE